MGVPVHLETEIVIDLLAVRSPRLEATMDILTAVRTPDDGTGPSINPVLDLQAVLRVEPAIIDLSGFWG